MTLRRRERYVQSLYFKRVRILPQLFWSEQNCIHENILINSNKVVFEMNRSLIFLLFSFERISFFWLYQPITSNACICNVCVCVRGRGRRGQRHVSIVVM